MLVGTRSAPVGLAFEGRLGIKKSSAVSPGKVGICSNPKVVVHMVTEAQTPI